jgi:hypothetical protein
MMPIMTGGISALPANVVNAGSAFNTLAQRVTSALGLAALTALTTGKQAQLMLDRSELLTAAGPGVLPRIAQMQQQAPAEVLLLWQQLKVEVQAQSLSDVFLISGICTLAGLFLAVFLRQGRPSGAEPAEVAEVG